MTALLNLSHISKHYHVGNTTVEALKDIQLTLKKGEFVAVIGPSGSGKSTLLNICGLLAASDQGEYYFRQHAIHQLSSHELTRLRRQYIGFIFQHFNLIPVMNALENVEYPLMLTGLNAQKRQQHALNLLQKVGLQDVGHHVPDRLSGGQRQRVAIARALIKSPQLVIADEPTANLDTVTAHQIIDLMQQLSHEQNTSFLIATHDDRMIKRCDRVLHLEDGVLRT